VCIGDKQFTQLILFLRQQASERFLRQPVIAHRIEHADILPGNQSPVAGSGDHSFKGMLETPEQ